MSNFKQQAREQDRTIGQEGQGIMKRDDAMRRQLVIGARESVVLTRGAVTYRLNRDSHSGAGVGEEGRGREPSGGKEGG